MRLRQLFTAVAALSFGGVSLATASPADGLWHAPVKNATIQVYACGSDVCGRVVDSDDLRANPDMRDARNKDASLRTRPIKGLVMMSNFKGGPTEWTDGTLYDPDSGNTYHGSIALVGHDTLNLKGCIFGPLCRTQTWHRSR